jgi:hypothetical protein
MKFLKHIELSECMAFNFATDGLAVESKPLQVVCGFTDQDIVSVYIDSGNVAATLPQTRIVPDIYAREAIPCDQAEQKLIAAFSAKPMKYILINNKSWCSRMAQYMPTFWMQYITQSHRRLLDIPSLYNGTALGFQAAASEDSAASDVMRSLATLDIVIRQAPSGFPMKSWTSLQRDLMMDDKPELSDPAMTAAESAIRRLWWAFKNLKQGVT